MSDFSEREDALDSDASSEHVICPNAKRIGEVAGEYGVSLRTLRFYEDKGLLAPERVGNSRFYHARDLARLRLILVGRKVGFSLREVKQLMDLYDREGPNTRQFKAILERSERQMRRLEKQRVELAESMDALKGLIDEARSHLEGKVSKQKA